MFLDLITTEHHYLFYLLGFFIFYQSYFVLDTVLKCTHSQYRLLDKKKQMYTVSNILKSGALASITPPACYILYKTMIHNEWNNTMIRNLGIIYAIPDGVSLILVEKMDVSTKVHHAVVCLFNIISMHNDYTEESVVRCMVIYACFSTFAFLVNFLLGVRYINRSRRLERLLARTSFIIYSICCCINWFSQVRYMSALYNTCNQWSCKISIPLYGSMIMAIGADDIILNKWLYKKSKFPELVNTLMS